MKYLIKYKLFENIDIDTMSEDDKINLIENNIDEVKSKDNDGLISDSIFSKVKNGLAKTLAVATISALVMMTLQSCKGPKSCKGYGWEKARREHLK